MITKDSATLRARALLEQMTLDEKVGQLQQYFCFGDASNLPGRLRAEAEKMEAAVDTGTTGSLLFVRTAKDTNRWQRRHLEASRLKIPLLFGFDVIHGLRTIFPVPIAMAASFDPDLVEACQATAAREARAVGIHWAFAPMVDIARDPRWGRIVEGAGEDPFLGSVMAAAQVRGFQGDVLGSPDRVIAGPKHFAGYGAALGGRDYDEVNLSDYELHNVYLPPFKAAVNAGAANIMTAYMPLNGVPATANHWLLTEILRKDWGFDGFVVSDANAAFNLTTHGMTHDPVSAAAAAINAGLDMEMSTGSAAFTELKTALALGQITQATIDQAVLRVLAVKLKLGLFDDPFVDEDAADEVLGSPAHRDLARRAAERSFVLLKNDGGILPLLTQKKIAVIGPLANSARDQLGPWVFDQNLEETRTILDGLKECAPVGVEVGFAVGAPLPARTIPWPFGQMETHTDAKTLTEVEPQVALAEAVALAASSEVAIVVLGERFDMSGEIASRSTLDLPGGQLDLLQAVAATGTPVVLLLMSGRPLDLSWPAAHIPAIVAIWHPGTSGGSAVANLVFGLSTPGGKLPFSWPRRVGQVPVIYSHTRSHDPAGHGRRYWEGDSGPLFPFGFGLSYGALELSNMRLSRPIVAVGEGVTVEVDVANSGDRPVDEVVQVYVRQKWGTTARPVRELKAFQRARLEPGERRTLSLSLSAETFRHWSSSCKVWVSEVSDFEVSVGFSSQTNCSIPLSVVSRDSVALNN